MTNKPMATVGDVLAALETFAPRALAETWDNPGLQVGDPAQAVAKIWTALDPIPEVIAKASAARCDLLLTHHPLFFHPVTKLDLSQTRLRGAALAIKSDLAVLAAHTNLDSAHMGVNQILAEQIGLEKITPLIPALTVDATTGLGRLGMLPRAMTLGELATQINRIFGGGTLRVVGDLNMQADLVAVCSGSGGSLIPEFIQSGANIFVSGDFSYHQALEAEADGFGLIDLGHFRSERIVVEPLAQALRAALAGMGFDVVVEAYTAQTEPFKFIGD